MLLKWYQQTTFNRSEDYERAQEARTQITSWKMRQMNLHPNNIWKQKKKEKQTPIILNSDGKKNFFYDTEEYSLAYKIARTDSYWHVSLVKLHHKT